MSNSRALRWRDDTLDAELLRASGTVPPLPMHHHPTWQLGMVQSGQMAFVVRGRQTSVMSPGLALVPPRVPHRVLGIAGTEATYVQAELPEALDMGTWSAQRLTHITDPQAIGAFEAMVEASHSERSAHARRGRLAELVALLQRLAHRAVEQPAHDVVVERVVQHLEATTTRSVAIAELVQISGLSRASLLRRFRHTIGTTPRLYHLSVRVRAACDAIDAGRSLAAAASSAGFYDQSHLTRQTREVLAMGPARWRARRRVGPDVGTAVPIWPLAVRLARRFAPRSLTPLVAALLEAPAAGNAGARSE